MTRNIQQTVEFEGVSPGDLFDIYVDPAKHAAAVGGPVTMGRAAGARFTVFGIGRVRGTNLLVVPQYQYMVVQTWRAQLWKDSEPDSILVLMFSEGQRGGRIQLVQAGVPDRIADVIDSGWHQTYWRPWRAYLRMRESYVR